MTCPLCSTPMEGRCPQCGGNGAIARLVAEHPAQAAGLAEVAALSVDRKIEAIKRLRELFPLTLAASKDVVEGVGYPPPAAASPQDPTPHLLALIANGQKILAIKCVRELHGVGLREALAMVEALERGTPLSPPSAASPAPTVLPPASSWSPPSSPPPVVSPPPPRIVGVDERTSSPAAAIALLAALAGAAWAAHAMGWF